MIQREKEGFRPNDECLALVQECAARIACDHVDLESWFREYSRAHSVRVAFDLEIVKRYATASSAIVEVGSIPLLLTVPLTTLGFNVKGVDIDPTRFSFAISSMGLKVVECNVETERLPFETKYFDIAVFNELFEHLRINPIFTMKEVHRVLKPGGLLIMSTPNLRSLRGLANFLLLNRSYSCGADIYEEYQKLERLGHMGHVREYTTREVSDFLSKMGFRLEALIFRGGYHSKIARLVIGLVPSLRPFVTYVARADR